MSIECEVHSICRHISGYKDIVLGLRFCILATPYTAAGVISVLPVVDKYSPENAALMTARP